MQFNQKKPEAVIWGWLIFSYVHFCRVASKLPQPNLHLLKHLLSLLHHISKNAKVNKMDSSNLAICFGPTMLSPNWDKSLPLEIQKELADKVPWVSFHLFHIVSFIFDLFFSSYKETSQYNMPGNESLRHLPDSQWNSFTLEIVSLSCRLEVPNLGNLKTCGIQLPEFPSQNSGSWSAYIWNLPRLGTHAVDCIATS